MNVYKAISAWNIVADAAIVGYLSGEKFGTKALSYLNGDTLYPHFDSITGELELFARKYYDYDEAGNESVEHVEVWDDTYLYRYSNEMQEDRKSTRLNSSHANISYAVFCLKKKT